MANLTREQILARKTGKGTATMPDGNTVAIRSLTRDEALRVSDIADSAEKCNYIIATGMTDPKLTVEDVAAWGAEGDVADLQAVMDAIAEISGMQEGAGKSGVAGA